MENILLSLLCLPVFGAILIALMPNNATRQMKGTALTVSLLNFLLSLNLWIFFDNSTSKFQFVTQFNWFEFLNMQWYIGIDGISLFFIILTTFLVPVCLLISWSSITHLVGTTDLQVLMTTEFSERRQFFLWLAFFFSFAVKVPMIPFHIWLPEAHVEAPTSGSVILAGILLKLGTYGFLRFSIPLFPEATVYFTPLIYTLSVLGIIYASFTTLRQIDLKKIIAYSSVAHMGFVTLGLFSLNAQGIEGAILLMLSHGFVASALFLCIGILYDRTHTRLIRYYGGLVQTMPLFSFFFFVFTLGNLSLPGTSSFVGEFLILLGVFQTNTFIATLAATGMILGGAYSIWLYNRVVFGNLKPIYLNQFADLNRREFFILLPFVVCIFWMGIYPSIFLESFHLSVANILQNH